ncbi:EsaB/YukD family protein [Dactylosporangium sp. CA-092794]|uniref:EsaB/YukD family protein n=1 Tax=Dactylosporangium sp. CA-092794 TaxID=3239929 RepID=UPI003D8C2653
MVDELSRITVIGARRRVDIAVPSRAPVGEYVTRLADLCGQDRDNVLPAAWSLAPAGGAVLPLNASLADAHVPDGQVLYLRDLTDRSNADPVVDELDEVVAEAADRHRWGILPRGVVLTVLGLLWVAATALYLAVRTGPADVLVPAVALSGTAVVLLAAAWSMAQRRGGIPPVLVLLTSLSAVPCLAGAGVLVAVALAGAQYGWAGAVIGANAGAAMAIAAAPEPVLLAVELQLAVAGLLTPIVIGAGLHGDGLAALAAVTAIGLLATARWSAGGITAAASRPPRPDAGFAGEVTALLVRGSRLLAVVMAGPAVVLVAATGTLANSDNGWAALLALIAVVGLLGRTAQTAFGAELVVLGTAGFTALFVLLVALSRRLALGGLGVLLLAVVGLFVVGLGVSMVLRHRPPPPAPPPGGPEDVIGATPPIRRTVAEVLVTLCDLAALPVAMGAFGLLGSLSVLTRGWVS